MPPRKPAPEQGGESTFSTERPRHAHHRSPQAPRRRRAGRARVPRPRRHHRQDHRPDGAGRRARREADRLSRDLDPRLPVVDLARLAGLGHAVRAALPRQLAGDRLGRVRAPAGGRAPAFDLALVRLQREGRGQPLHRAGADRRPGPGGADAPQAQAHARGAHRVRRRRRRRPARGAHRHRQHRLAVLLGTPAAAEQVRDVLAERADPLRGLAQLRSTAARPTRWAPRSTMPRARSMRSRAAASCSRPAPRCRRR